MWGRNTSEYRHERPEANVVAKGKTLVSNNGQTRRKGTVRRRQLGTAPRAAQERQHSV